MTERSLAPRLRDWPVNLAAAAGIVMLAAVVLRAMGREFISDAGLGLWTGAWTTSTSQWLADPYSTSHILHGVIFYWALTPLGRWLSVAQRFVIALLIECGWELLENSPVIIDRYRAATASLDYYGDSIINSICDISFAALGFALAWRLPWKGTLALVVAVELIMLATVRDNLTLNVLMLIYPFESIKEWQVGG